MPSNDSNYGDFTTTARLPGARHVLKKPGSSAVECRTRIKRAWVGLQFVTVSKFRHIRSYHDTPAHSAVRMSTCRNE